MHHSVGTKFVFDIETYPNMFLVMFKEIGGVADTKEHHSFFYKVDGLPEGMCFDVKELLSLEHVCNNVFFDTERNMAFCFSEKGRGVVCGAVQPHAVIKDTDEDIPF